jgi:anti-sigma regulatory factor (Ser/Thr protein kinase)
VGLETDGVSLGVDRPLLAVPETVPRVRHAVSQLARRLAAQAAAVEAVELAVTEACANVVLHAYPNSGPIEVRARAVDRRLTVRVRDWGVGLRVQSERRGLGLGLRLIASVCEGFEARDADPGTEVLMTFDLDRRQHLP